MIERIADQGTPHGFAEIFASFTFPRAYHNTAAQKFFRNVSGQWCGLGRRGDEAALRTWGLLSGKLNASNRRVHFAARF